MFLKKLDHNIYDCFDGVGWDNWVRMEQREPRIWYIVAGSPRYAAKAAAYLNRKLYGDE